MKTITRIIAFLVTIIALAFNSEVKAQSVLNPADPIVTYSSANPPAQPAYGQIGKWVRTKRLNWNTDAYKAYFYKGSPFRVKFPKSYLHEVADGKTYPMIIMFHGRGEAGTIYDNEYSLYHGGQTHLNAVNNDKFDGFVFYMQNQGGSWGEGHYNIIAELIDYMITNNKVDPFRVSVHGLSFGGEGAWKMTIRKPTYVAASLPMSNASIYYRDDKETLKWIPMWVFQGGLDGNPAPATTIQVRDAILNVGGNFKYTLYPNLGHGTWNTAYAEADFFPYMLRAHKANPWPLFGRAEFCPGDPINITIGVSPGFNEYRWRKNGVMLPNTGNQIQVTTVGIYECQVRKGSIWSPWSPKPLEVKVKGVTVSPTPSVAGLASKVLPATDGHTTTVLEVPANYTSYVWQRVGNSTTLSTTNTLNAGPGNYRVRVTEQFGCSSDWSAPFTIVDANGPNKPDPAINLIVSTLSKTSLRLDWSDNPSPAHNETNFEIYQANSAGGTYHLVAITGADVLNYNVTGLDANTNYFFKVRAVNETGAASPSNEATGTTAADTQAPTAPTNLVVLGTTKSSISLDWTAATDDVGVVQYDVYVNGVKAFVTNETQYTVFNLTHGQSYNFTIKARDFAGNVSPFSNQVTGQALLSGLTFKHYLFEGTWNTLQDFNALTPALVGLTPNISITNRLANDNFAYLWEGYIVIPTTGTYYLRTRSDDGSKLYLGPKDGVNSPYSHTAIATVDNDGLHGAQDRTSAALNLQAGVYPIAISFYEQSGGESMSISWRTPATGTSFVTIPNSAFNEPPQDNGAPPATPANLVAATNTYDRIDLSWEDLSDNETGFEIWRSTSRTTGFLTVGLAPANTTFYVDTALAANTTYYYRLRAIGQHGESGYTYNYTEALWQLNNNYTDVTGNGYTLSPNGGPFFSTTDKAEGTHSILLNAANNRYLSLPTNNNFLRTAYSEKTVAFWMRTATNTGTRIIFDIGGNDDGIALAINNNTLWAGVVSNNAGRTSISAPYTSADWNHIAVVYNKNSLRLYVNGLEVAANNSLPFTALTTTTNSSRIGANNSSNAFNVTLGLSLFNGYIDNFGVYETAMTQAAIASLMTSHTAGQSHARTSALPPVPETPSNLVADAYSTSKVSVIWNDVTGETGFEVYRSSNNNSNYVLMATLPADQNNYSDTALFANAVYYYKVRAINVGGASGYSNEDSAKVWNNIPVLNSITNKVMRHSSSLELALQATDLDPETLDFSFSNLPAFANFNATGNGAGQLVFTPGALQQGTYSNITVVVTDQNNGSATLSFDLLVNDNYVPVLTGVTNVTVKEKLTAQLNLMATDQNPADQLTWNITGLPSFATLTTNAGIAQIQFAPGYADNGSYPIAVTVEDGNTGSVTSNFVLTVTDVNPNKKIYVNFTDGTYQGAAPWNNTNKIPALNDLFANLNDETGTNSGISLQVTSSWQNIGNGTNVLGVNTGNNSGVYPDVVMRSAYFTTTAPQSLRIQGLDLNSRYKITFFGSRSSVSDNRNTVYTINGNSVMLNAASNSTNTVNLPNLQPNVDGTLDLTVQTGVSAQYAYLNAMVIESIFDDGTAPAKPRSLVASNLVNSIGLNWVDAAYNETSYQVYRSGTATGPYTLLNPGGNNAGLHTYNDESIAPNSTYYYYVTATNAYGVSPSSDTVVVETGNTSPVLAALANVTMETYQTVNVNVTATDEPGDVITLTAGNLPSFATFTDNGNGTGVLKLKPEATTGTFNNIQVTATDNKGASSFKTFNLVVQLNGLNRIQVNFNQVTPVGAPWNSFTATPAAGRSLSNMVTTEGTVTTTGIALVEGWDAANNVGAVTGNNSGIFPDAVMSTAYYHSSSITKTIRLSGLSPARRYNLIFFGSRAGVNDNRTTMFSASGQSVTLNAASNTSNTVQINGLVPNSQGNLEFTVAKGSGSAFAYLNALVIESYVEGSGSGEGITLQASGISKTQIQLNWSTDAINQTACEVYRSTTQNGVYSLLTTLAGSATSYTDQNLSANTQFYYKLRTVAAGPVYSEYSNIATAATLSYLVYINFNSDLPAPAPWNNTNSLPQDGNVYSNMINDAGNPTGINMTVQGTAFNGVNTLGSVTGNNSGVYPDNVTRSTWWLDRGGVVRLKIDGLSQAMGYNFTFFASRDGGGNFADRTTLYTIGSKSTSLNAINNVSQTATIYNVRADNNGAVYIDIQAGGASPYAYIGALVIQAASVTELAEEGQFLRRGYGETTEEYVSPFAVAEKDTPSAFPNPFIDDVTLNLSLSQPVKQLKVQVLDVSGRVLFTRELRELNQGISRHKLGMNGRNWAPGIYMIEVTGLPGQASGTVQLIKK